ncbi:MAG: hypothetical protein Q8O67_20820 [Deltaproteobacteria bacterium]|nr:hypothetical protein [Deltaproteobacteria bacterium]
MPRAIGELDVDGDAEVRNDDAAQAIVRFVPVIAAPTSGRFCLTPLRVQDMTPHHSRDKENPNVGHRVFDRGVVVET